MKRILAVLLICLLAVALFAGCSTTTSITVPPSDSITYVNDGAPPPPAIEVVSEAVVSSADAADIARIERIFPISILAFVILTVLVIVIGIATSGQKEWDNFIKYIKGIKEKEKDERIPMQIAVVFGVASTILYIILLAAFGLASWLALEGENTFIARWGTSLAGNIMVLKVYRFIVNFLAKEWATFGLAGFATTASVILALRHKKSETDKQTVKVELEPQESVEELKVSVDALQSRLVILEKRHEALLALIAEVHSANQEQNLSLHGIENEIVRIKQDLQEQKPE